MCPAPRDRDGRDGRIMKRSLPTPPSPLSPIEDSAWGGQLGEDDVEMASGAESFTVRGSDRQASQAIEDLEMLMPDLMLQACPTLVQQHTAASHRVPAASRVAKQLEMLPRSSTVTFAQTRRGASPTYLCQLPQKRLWVITLGRVPQVGDVGGFCTLRVAHGPQR